ncbi:MAG: RHS repeat-associated core domain-containing protein [Saprospiraceae bacterium]|nr:RHS repeat-associated core domain-containing protein [Saprospiraceae bacterium]
MDNGRWIMDNSIQKTGRLVFDDTNGTFEYHYDLKDHLGSIRVITNANSDIVETYDYDAFGNVMESTVTVNSSYQYTGQEYDDEVDLHNFRARFYDSDLMRFYAVDPAMSDASPYLFCGNNPISYVDPDGEFPIIAAIIIAYAVYNGVQTAEATGNPWDFMIGFNQTVCFVGGTAVITAATLGTLAPTTATLFEGSKIFMTAASSAISTTVSSAIFTGEPTTGFGQYSYNWSTGKKSTANPFDKDNFITNASEFMSWVSLYEFALECEFRMTTTPEYREALSAFKTNHPGSDRGFLDDWGETEITKEELDSFGKPLISADTFEGKIMLQTDVNHPYQHGLYWGGLHIDKLTETGPYRAHIDTNKLSLGGIGLAAHLAECIIVQPGIGPCIAPVIEPFYYYRDSFRNTWRK